MSREQTVFSSDLAGIVVGETAISDVQGDKGLLSYRGVDITELVGQPFPRVVWLVLFGQWPSAAEEQRLADFMLTHSQLTDKEEALLRQVPKGLHPMLVLQGLVPLLQQNPSYR